MIFILGAWLGTSNVAMVAFADERGSPGFSGVLIGLMVLAGSVAGLIYGGMTWRLGLVPRTSVTEGFAWVASSITVGSSAGVAMSGYLVDRFGGAGALQFFAACAVAVPLVVISLRTLLARTPYTEQAESVEQQAGELGGGQSGAVDRRA